ncbi:hypothetical protein D8674_024414 [Pyrus ussuriensis x Pyrus communis]|uniref:Uncharacterized protein n=1 Tax=Pyrus ussuriensis x Pyrus communis TaxID=2448454 RepID=A0A5N5H7X4_9ROSA|nr:hypothetical protein D8674_024414 [Pyrus ussuriensis x Pyrus communis]
MRAYFAPHILTKPVYMSCRGLLLKYKKKEGEKRAVHRGKTGDIFYFIWEEEVSLIVIAFMIWLSSKLVGLHLISRLRCLHM